MPLDATEVRVRLDLIFNGRRTCPADRRYALALLGIPMNELNEELGYHRDSGIVSEVIANKRPGKVVRRRLAQLLDLPEERFFNDD